MVDVYDAAYQMTQQRDVVDERAQNHIGVHGSKVSWKFTANRPVHGTRRALVELRDRAGVEIIGCGEQPGELELHRVSRVQHLNRH